MSHENEELGRRIHAFLRDCAKSVPSWTEDEPEEERFNGPDSSMLYAAATDLLEGRTPRDVWSSWSSGCYRGDRDARLLHDELVDAVAAVRNNTRSPSA